MSTHHVEGFSKLHKVAIHWGLVESSLLDSRPKSEDMVDGMVVPTKPYLPCNIKPSHVNHPQDVSLNNHGIELGQSMTIHDCAIISRLSGILQFEDGLDDIGSPRLRKIGTNGIIEKSREEGEEGVNSVFEELQLKVLNVGGLA